MISRTKILLKSTLFYRPLAFSYQSSRASSSVFDEVLEKFPQQRSLVFAYGSGVFLQEGQETTKQNMTDFIIAVKNTEQWHKENLERHPNHYSSLARALGSEAVARCQENWGARLYFNTLVPFGNGLIKYGVISKEDLITDLTAWESLYVAGRLHKPVNILEQEEDNDLKKSLSTNLNSAVHTALLLLPEKFTEEQLFLTIAGLSYTGDFRMVVGEDKNKVSNIVRPQIERFRQLYWKRLEGYVKVNEGMCEQDMCKEARSAHIENLPVGVSNKLLVDGECNFDASKVSTVVGRIVAGADKTQAAKGILTAGGRKTIVYSFAKLKKMIKSLK